MSETPATDSTQKSTPAAPKSRKKLILIIVLLLLMAGGGGVASWLYFGGAVSEAKADKGKRGRKSQPPADEHPGADGEETEGEGSRDQKGVTKEHPSLPDDEEVKEVIELQPFIVNLSDSNEARYLRATISLGLAEGENEKKPDPLFTTRVRNALLTVLSAKSSSEVLSSEGKAKLRTELLEAARSTVGGPEVRAIYITDFIVQL
jgi:flagellar FliL protein